MPAGVNAKLWVLEYVALPGHPEWLYFWAAAAALVWAWKRGQRVEALFIAAFLASHAVYLYRPFPFTRYVSVLLPLALMVADALKQMPRLQTFVVAAALVLSVRSEALLFLNRWGEP